MQELVQLTEKLANAVMMADPTDLPRLADMHSHLQSVAKQIAQLDEQARTPWLNVSQTAGSAEKLVERIILRDVGDAAEALNSVTSLIADLQQLVRSAAEGLPPPNLPASAPADVAPAPKPVQNQPQAPTAAHPPADAVRIDPETPVNVDDLPLVVEFVGEANSHIESAEGALLKLEEEPDNLEIVNAIFRSFHTIKGVAGFLNLKQIGALAHSAENLLDLARQSKLRLTGSIVDVILESIDQMKVMVAALDQVSKIGAALPVQATLPDLIHRLHLAAENKLDSAASSPSPVHSPEKSPAPQADSTPAPSAENAAPTLKIAPTSLPQPADAAAEKSEAKAPSAAPAQEATVKVATDRLDSLINMVGELVIAQAMVSQDMSGMLGGNQRLARNMGHLSKITRELQDLSMSMRMVPIAGVFQKMSRLVRDLARKIGKNVDLEVVGGETELDRNVVEAISDPLIHMVRNSVDHGIETPEERIKSGKPPEGKVELRAYHQAGNIVIEIRDDGKGLNKERILRKAVQNGIVSENAQLSDQDIFKLIFHAGLSTAEKITDVSGRGVGMDVVKKNVEALRGRIEIESETGRGSIFTIRLPLTLAVIDGLVVRVGEKRYIVPILAIEQSLRPKPQQLSTVQSRGEMVHVRGTLMPLCRLHRLFGVKPSSEDPSDALVVIVQDDDRRCCLLVDELLGQQQVVIKSLGDSMGQIPGVSGGAILGDGNVSLILDVPGLMELATRKAA